MTVTLRNGASEIPTPPGTLIHKIQQDRQWRLMLRGLDESKLAEFRAGDNVGAVEVRQPNLEEIYVSYMQGQVDSASKPL